jgi:dipeptidyl aminopeptidase/acylaminoacyl peptidase
MNKVKLSITAVFLLISISLFSQSGKKNLKVQDLMKWNHLEEKGITNNGEWVFYEVKPYEGDGKLHLWDAANQSKAQFQRATEAKFSANSDYIAFKIKPCTDTVRKMKLNKVPKKKLLKDSMGIYIFDTEKLIKKEKIKSFKLAEKKSGWMAYQHEKIQEKKDSTDNNKPAKKADKSAPEATKLTIYNPSENKEHHFENVTEYTISEKGDLISFIRLQNDSLLKSTLFVFNTNNEKLDSIFSEEGLSKNISIDHGGEQLSFIHSADTTKNKVYSLYYWSDRKDEPKKIVDTLTQSIPEKWTVGEHGKIYFSDNDDRLYFGTKKRDLPEPKDTLLEEEKVKVDVWNWKDPLLQPQQLKNLEKEKKRTYLAVYHIKDDKIVQLANEKIRNVKPILKGDGDVAIGTNRQPYHKLMSWEMPPYKDIYLVNINTGKKKLIKQKIQSRIDIAPGGKYFYWYSYADSNWYSYDIQSTKTYNLTKALRVNIYNEDHDYPNDPNSYGTAGWTEDDEYLLIYDRYDIWKLDPEGKENPVNLTNGHGRKNNIRFRYVKLDKDQEFIDTKEDMLLMAFNEKTKASGYYTIDVKGKNNPEKLLMDDYRFYRPLKADNEENIIWQKSSFQKYPDLWYSNLDFESPVKISETNPQQEKYNWGNVELVHWTAPNGKKAEGMLYKPENFDPDKKYPMIVYFYRLSSRGLHRHHTPKPSRSVINRTFYVSNDYLVFVPNIRYDIGYPGESAHEYVTSGTLSMIDSRPYIDKNKIGLQGQSWGGYQIAHIITMTDMFAAAHAGAPVSNMTSAYGGIRWGSGMSRMFQYEETQSRIGGTLWEKPLHYIQNSPVFYAPRVNTPLMMRHNDGDGAVPWYQGIEYFVALRRLGKPVWMLNYNDAPHNERDKSPNCKDLTIRMKQFFDHYLKDEPAPVWMEKGIPALKKGKTRGYELVK